VIILFANHFEVVESFEEIKNVAPSKIPLFEFDKLLLQKTATLTFATTASSIIELLWAHHYKAKYILVKKEFAPQAQKIAEEYLFDSKILVPIIFEWEMGELAKLGIDGVVLR